MTEKMQVLVVGANRYQFEDKQDKRTVTGCKVHYIELQPTPDKHGNTVGALPASVNLPYEEFPKFSKLPAIFALDMGFRIYRGKPEAVVIGVEYVEQAEIVTG